MGFGDIKGTDCFDALADIMEPALKIAQDDEAKKLFGVAGKRPEGMSAQEYGIKIMGEYFPSVIRNNKQHFAEILAVVHGMSVEEYLESVDFGSLVSDIMDLVSDPVFKSFLS